MISKNPFFAVIKVLLVQMAITVVITLICLLVSSQYYAYSAFLGGGIAILPNILFAYKIYLARHFPAQDIVNAFYIGETLKLVLTVALFILVLQMLSVDFLTLLLAYAAVLSVFWFALFYLRN